jgi:hypothetical protein
LAQNNQKASENGNGTRAAIIRAAFVDSTVLSGDDLSSF